MRVRQTTWTREQGWGSLPSEDRPPDLVLLFGGRAVFEEGTAIDALGAHWPRECFFGCSTAGEIAGDRVTDDTLVATGLWLERTKVVSSVVSLDAEPDSEQLGKTLAQALPADGLSHVLVFSDGVLINGAALSRGLRAGLPANVTFSGGLAGDGPDMKKTWVCHAGKVQNRIASLVGFRGPMTIGMGSVGGWDTFGPVRRITAAQGSVLMQLDGEPALAVYRRYLGEHTHALPFSALLFPLLITDPAGGAPVVRTIVGMNEEAGSLIFAGDMPVGASAQLMRANFERIIAAGESAGEASRLKDASAELALLVSCVGRKLILKQRVEEEVEAVRYALGDQVPTAGFYSYGEIAPAAPGAPCQLHNQTMTVTTVREAA